MSCEIILRSVHFDLCRTLCMLESNEGLIYKTHPCYQAYHSLACSFALLCFCLDSPTELWFMSRNRVWRVCVLWTYFPHHLLGWFDKGRRRPRYQVIDAFIWRNWHGGLSFSLSSVLAWFYCCGTYAYGASVTMGAHHVTLNDVIRLASWPGPLVIETWSWGREGRFDQSFGRIIVLIVRRAAMLSQDWRDSKIQELSGLLW